MRIIAICVLSFALFGCASPRYFGNGRYTASDYDHPTSPEEGFNEYDEHFLIQQALNKFSDCSDHAHVVMLDRFDNQTSEMLDAVALSRRLTDELSVEGYTVIDKSSRPDLHNEYIYSQAGYVDPGKAPRMGKQEGVNLLLRAVLQSETQVGDDGDTKTVRYRLSLQGVDTESALVKCNGIAELKKQYERTRVGL